jgi:hypothetical protein
LRINPLNQKYDVENDKKMVKEESHIHDIASSIYRGRKSPVFTPEIYFDVGQSLLVALLDYDYLNPISRLLKKKGDSLEEAVQKIKKEMMKADEKPSIS